MMSLDTHVVVWLHAGEIKKLPPAISRRLDSENAVISPMVKLELEYLLEAGKIRLGADEILSDLATDIGLTLCDYAFPSIIQEALRLTWTRDPFDRIIVAHALSAGYQLITKDRNILKNCSVALWR